MNMMSRIAAGTALATVPAPALAALTIARPDTRAWDKAVAREKKAQDAVDRYDREFLAPVSDRYCELHRSFGTPPLTLTDEQRRQLDATGMDAVQERFDYLVGVQWDAMMDLMLMPAPSVGALAYKLAMLHERELHDARDIDGLARALAEDGARLARTALH